MLNMARRRASELESAVRWGVVAWLGVVVGVLSAGEMPVGHLVTRVEPVRHDITGGSRIYVFGDGSSGGFAAGDRVEINGAEVTGLTVLSTVAMTGLVPANPVGMHDVVLRDSEGGVRFILADAVEYVVLNLPPVEDVTATRVDEFGVRLRWSNPTANDRIRIRRNGATVATLAGDETEYTDTLPFPPTSAVLYELVAEAGVRVSTPGVVQYLPWRDECLPILGTGGSGRASGIWAALISGGIDELQMCFHLEEPAPAVLFQVFMSKVRLPGQLKCRVRSMDPPHDVLGAAYDGIVVEDFELFREDYSEAVLPAPLAAGDYIVGFYSDGVEPNQWSYELQVDADAENPGEPCPPPFYPMLKITPLCNNLPPTVLDITSEAPNLSVELDPNRFPFGIVIVSELGRTIRADAMDFDGAVVNYGWVFSYACNRRLAEDEAQCLERCRLNEDCLDAGNSAGNSILYNFPYSGNWIVGVTVTDNAGATAYASETIYVDVYAVPPDCGEPPGIYEQLEPDIDDPFYAVRYIPDINETVGEVNQKFEVRVTPSDCASIESVDMVMIDPSNGTEYPPLGPVSIVAGSVDAATRAARYAATFNMSELGYSDRFELHVVAEDDGGLEGVRNWTIPMCLLPLLFDSDHNHVNLVDTSIEYDSGNNRYDVSARFPDRPVLDLPIDIDELGLHLDNVVDAYLKFKEYLDDEFWHPQEVEGKVRATLLGVDLFEKEFEVSLDGPVAYGCDDYEIQFHADDIELFSEEWSWELFDATIWEGFIGPVHVRVRGSLDVGMGIDLTAREVRLIVRTVEEEGDPVVEIGVEIVPAVEAWAEGEIRVEVFFGLASASVLLRPTVGIEFPIELQAALPTIALGFSVDDCFRLKVEVKVRACVDIPFFDEECLSSDWLEILDEEWGMGCEDAPGGLRLGVQDEPSILKYPSIAVAPNGETAMAVFVDDRDPDPSVYSPDLFYSLDTGEGFGKPMPMRDVGDNYTQRDSSVVFLNNAQALAVWTQGRLTRNEIHALPQTVAGANAGFNHQDIFFALWNGDGGWGPSMMLTNDGAPNPLISDGKPVVAAIPGDDAAWVVWVRANDAEFINGNGNPELRDLSIFARKIDGGVPGPMFRITSDDVANPAADIQPAVAVSPSGDVALAVWVRDADGDFDTAMNRRLMYSVNLGSGWGPPVSLTNPSVVPGVLMPSVALNSDDDGMVAFTVREVDATGRIAGEGNKDLIHTIEIRNAVAQDCDPATTPTKKRGERIFNGVYGRDPIVRYLDSLHAVLIYRSFDGFGRNGGDGEVGISVIDFSQSSPRWSYGRDLTQDEHRDWDIAAGVGPSCIRTVRDSTGAAPGFRGMVFQDIVPAPDIVVDRIRLSNPHAPAGSMVTATVVVRNGGLLSPPNSTLPTFLRFGTVVGGVFVEQSCIPMLFTAAPDMTQEFSLSFIVPEEVTRLRAVADPIASEFNTTNNMVDVMLGVLPPREVMCTNVRRDTRPKVGLSWQNSERYEAVWVYRDGRLMTQLDGDVESFFDRTASPGMHTWSIRGKIGEALSDPVAANCELQVLLPGDFDLDEDVDGDDLGSLIDPCFGGPQVAYAPGCDVFDIEGDGDVDLRDIAFQTRAFTGNLTPNLLRNPSFEEVPGNFTGQGLLPDHWVVIAVTPDTYSNDGSFGLSPSSFGNFTGVVARSGMRWVAAWGTTTAEMFGQQLSTPLLPNQEYRLSCWLHQAIRSDIAHPGTYEFLLASSPAALLSATVLGRFAPTTMTQWEFRSLEFTSPPDSPSRPWLIFRPVPTGTVLSTYPGLDGLLLIHAPN